MTRLIDADLLEKEIYKWMPKDQETWMSSDIPTIENLVVSIMMTIQEQPTVDAVPVILCKDCIYWKRYCRVVDGVTSNHVCGRKRELDGLMHRSKADDFCSLAERKEE